MGVRGLGAGGAWGGVGLGRRGLVLSWKSPGQQRKLLAANQSDSNSEADTKVAGFCIRMDLAIKECQTTSTIRDLADGRLGQHYPRPRRWTLGQHYPRPRRWTLGHYPRPRRWTPTQGMEDTRMKGHAWQLTLSRMCKRKKLHINILARWRAQANGCATCCSNFICTHVHILVKAISAICRNRRKAKVSWRKKAVSETKIS